MVTPDDFSVSSDRDGELTLDCPVGGCWAGIGIAYGLTLPELQAKAAEHLAAKHVEVVEGEVVPVALELAS